MTISRSNETSPLLPSFDNHEVIEISQEFNISAMPQDILQRISNEYADYQPLARLSATSKIMNKLIKEQTLQGQKASQLPALQPHPFSNSVLKYVRCKNEQDMSSLICMLALAGSIGGVLSSIAMAKSFESIPLSIGMGVIGFFGGLGTCAGLPAIGLFATARYVETCNQKIENIKKDLAPSASTKGLTLA